jgi:hypothetical protein
MRIVCFILCPEVPLCPSTKVQLLGQRADNSVAVRAQLTIYSNRRKTPSDVNVFKRQDNKAQAGRQDTSIIYPLLASSVCVYFMCEAEKSVCDVGGDFSEAAAFNKHTHQTHCLALQAQTHSRRNARRLQIKSNHSTPISHSNSLSPCEWDPICCINIRGRERASALTRDRCARLEIGNSRTLDDTEKSARFSMTLFSQVAEDARTFFHSIFTQSKSSVEFTLECCALAVNKIAPSIVSGLHLSKARAFPGTRLVKYSQNFHCSIVNRKRRWKPICPVPCTKGKSFAE